MASYSYQVTGIIVSIIIAVIYYKATIKKKLVKRIEDFYEHVNSHLHEYIEKWDEEKIIKQSVDIQIIIENKKYDFDEARRLIAYNSGLQNLIYKNNLEAIERYITGYLDAFNEVIGHGKRFIITPDIEIYSEQFTRETKEYSDKCVRYDSQIICNFMKIYNDPIEYLKNLNNKYIANEKNICKAIFDDIDGKSLDNNQRDAVVNDDLRQLVIAGAGSGKTLTMSAKVKYLVERKQINPKDILLISFTRKAASEMSERISRLGIDVDSSTFHKYGLSVLSKVGKKTPDIAENMSKYINAYVKEEIFNSNELARNFLHLLGTLMIPTSDPGQSIGEQIAVNQRQDLTTIKGLFEAFNKKKQAEKLDEEIIEHTEKLSPLREKLDSLSTDDIKAIQITNDEITELENIINNLKMTRRSIRNEQLKSAEEVILANTFFLDGVEYEYEKEYPYDEDDNFRKHYKPDFYLTESDLYWEHFGINKDGKAPQYNNVAEEIYLQGIEWKRNLHEKNHTKLAETYSWQFQDNSINSVIKQEYEKYGIQKHDVRYCDVLREILKGDSAGNIESFETLLSTFISLFKSNGYGTDKFAELNEKIRNYKDDSISIDKLERRKNRDTLFLTFAEDFYSFYTARLAEENKIDFNDMINHATALINNGEYLPNYKYVIIDEFQDISVGRYKLVKATCEKRGAKLFCVGDDWQSIYRFTGSEVDLLVNFEKYFGLHSRIDIDQTYRNSQELLDISGAFIQMNEYQRTKKLKSAKHIDNPVRIIPYSGGYNPILEDKYSEYELQVPIASAFRAALDDIMARNSESNDVLVLGRNNSDIQVLKDVKYIEVSQSEGETKINFPGYTNLNIRFLTVHRSKGLEAENVIVLNMRNSRSGFPNQIIDDPILALLRNGNETYPFAEERRLFYVAITRTKNCAYLLVPMAKCSRFSDDIKNVNLKLSKNCVGDCYPREFAAMAETIDDFEFKIPETLSCPVCQNGILVKRKGAEGKEFVSCSNFPACTYKASNLDAVRKNNRCPVCNNFLVRRNGRNGEFLGCMSYPICTYSTNISEGESDLKKLKDISFRKFDSKTVNIPMRELNSEPIFNPISDSNKVAGRAEYNARMGKPSNAQIGWTINEDQQLMEEYKAGKKIAEIAKIHQRTNGAITARLKKLCLID